MPTDSCATNSAPAGICPPSPNLPVRRPARPRPDSHPDSGPLFVDHSQHKPARGTFGVADGVAGGRTIAGDDHALMQAGAMGVDGHLGDALGLARRVDRLTDHQAPTFQARMSPSAYHV